MITKLFRAIAIAAATTLSSPSIAGIPDGITAEIGRDIEGPVSMRSIRHGIFGIFSTTVPVSPNSPPNTERREGYYIDTTNGYYPSILRLFNLGTQPSDTVNFAAESQAICLELERLGHTNCRLTEAAGLDPITLTIQPSGESGPIVIKDILNDEALSILSSPPHLESPAIEHVELKRLVKKCRDAGMVKNISYPSTITIEDGREINVKDSLERARGYTEYTSTEYYSPSYASIIYAGCSGQSSKDQQNTTNTDREEVGNIFFHPFLRFHDTGRPINASGLFVDDCSRSSISWYISGIEESKKGTEQGMAMDPEGKTANLEVLHSYSRALTFCSQFLDVKEPPPPAFLF